MVPAAYIRLCEELFVIVRMMRRSGYDHWEAPKLWRKLDYGHFSQVWSHKEYPELVCKISGPAGWACDEVVSTASQRYGNIALDAWPVYARHCQAHPHPNLPKIMHFVQHNQSLAWGIMPWYSEDTCGSLEFRHMVCRVLDGTESTNKAWLWPLRTMVEALNINVDLHEHNVMYDEESEEFVLTDPFSSDWGKPGNGNANSDVSGIARDPRTAHSSARSLEDIPRAAPL